jgi:S1-C subfamily serine protease
MHLGRRTVEPAERPCRWALGSAFIAYDGLMPRGLTVALLCLALPSAAIVQEVGVLRVRIVLGAAGQTSTPVRRHALLISDNPASAAPRRVLTSQDGTVEVRLKPGNYTVESDRPVSFGGKAFQWTQFVDVVAGADTVLELTEENAEAASGTASPLEEDASSIATRWQDSVVAVWSPTARASGFLIDSKGLLVTHAQAIGEATRVEVQLSRELKVPGLVVATDVPRDVAIVRIDATTTAEMKPVPLGCGESPAAAALGERLIAVEAPLRQDKGTSSGVVRRIAQDFVETDITSGEGGSGGPVFDIKGAVIGMTSPRDDRALQGRGDARVVRASEICTVAGLAAAKLDSVASPPPTRLPVEPDRPYPTAILENLVSRRAGNLNPYRMTASEFEVAFLTPVHVYHGQQRGAGRGSSGPPDAAWLLERLSTDFGNWSEYVDDLPPVLMVRVTPKLVESFWAKIARGAAYTQGVALPAIKHLESGFAGLRLYCGDTEVTPIHPFVIEQEVSDTQTVREGLYVFEPGAVSPDCGGVKVSLFSEKDPEKGDTRVVEEKVIRQVWEDFGPYREQP